MNNDPLLSSRTLKKIHQKYSANSRWAKRREKFGSYRPIGREPLRAFIKRRAFENFGGLQQDFAAYAIRKGISLL